MGLDCSHDAFHGAYTAFNCLRQFVCKATGGSHPPHWVYSPTGMPLQDESGWLKHIPDLEDGYFYCGEDYTKDKWPGLYEFLSHSDCDGEIAPEMCVKVADDLEKLIPQMEKLQWEAHGHIAKAGGFMSAVRKFIAGCRAAAAAGEPLCFF